MIPLPAEVKECLQKSIRLTSYTPFNQLICCISVSSYMLTRRFAVHLNRSLVGRLGIVIEKTDVAYLRSFPCAVVKRHLKLPAEMVGLSRFQMPIWVLASVFHR